MTVRKRAVTAATVGLISGAALAAPQVGNVTFSQAADRTVTVTYDLDAEAIVTVDFQTNVTGKVEGDVFASIGDKNIKFVTGDCNKFVTAGTGRKLYWHPDKSWEGYVFRQPMVRAVVTAWVKDSPPDYMVVDLNDYGETFPRRDKLRFYTSEEQLPEGIASDIYRTEKLVMRRIPAAGCEYMMGSPTNEYQRAAASEHPISASFTQDFYMSVFELTGKQYCLATGADNPSSKTVGAGDMQPVNNVSYEMARGKDSEGHCWPTDRHSVASVSLCGKLYALTDVEFDLPTEAQWEFACRAGTTGANYNGAVITSTSTTATWAELSEIAWYSGNSGGVTHRVGELKPNAFGLYDMLGNLTEPCLDWYKADRTAMGTTQVDPVGPEKGSLTEHPRRGSYYGWAACHARAGRRPNSNGAASQRTDMGIRLVSPVSLQW